MHVILASDLFEGMSHLNDAYLVDQVEEFEFELNEVYSIDIVMSTGEGRQLSISSVVSHFFRNCGSFFARTECVDICCFGCTCHRIAALFGMICNCIFCIILYMFVFCIPER